MTNPRTDHKTRKPAPPTLPARRDPASAPERPTVASAKMIEASDRLCQKLDEVADLFRQQIEAWRQIQPPRVPPPAPPERAGHRAADARGAMGGRAVEQTPPPSNAATAPPLPEGQVSQEEEHLPDSAAARPATPTPQDGPAPAPPPESAAPLPSGGDAPAPPASALSEDGVATTAQGALRLVDTLSQSGRAWPEQAAGLQQSLESIMTYLENQAATAPPKIDADGILSRLKDLEEQQQSLESRFNTSR